MKHSVWLVTSGSYSDYHVIAGFTEEHLAQGYVVSRKVDRKSTYQDDLEVEEYPLLDHVPAPAQIVTYATARVNPDRSLLDQWVTSYEREEWEAAGDSVHVEDHTVAPGVAVAGLRIISVHGTERDEVLRVFRERVADAIGAEPEPLAV